MALLSYTAAKTRVFVASGLKFAVNSRNLVDMTPIQRYELDLQAEQIIPDAAQRRAVEALDWLYHQVVERQEQSFSWRARLFGTRRLPPITGLYLWGGVGRGKTYLMDAFFDTLPIESKSRLHFNRFMQRVHEDLTQLAGVKNPLTVIADQLAREVHVLCFDEFYVSDIGDAMLLGGLMQLLFDRGITLVATSNIPPSDLYKDGLQRGRFIPAIKALEANVDVINVDSGIDYRLRLLTQTELYFCAPADGASDQLHTIFSDLTSGRTAEPLEIEVNKRVLQVKGSVEGVLYCSFDVLCLQPRSAGDYTQIAKEYSAVLVDDLPQMDGSMEDGARRFITMVDEFYDRNIKLILAADVPMEALYAGRKLAFEFQRTLSRLIEMQSVDYLAREHRP
jgi:cell division protein ZapE